MMSEKATYYGSAHDRYAEMTDDSTTHKIKSAFWTTKQVVIKKFGRKEDEHVVASDCALDAKLELFRSIERTCLDLSRIIDRYQDKICVLSQAENELGRFLKNQGVEDKTRAGKMMTAVGKSLSFSAQQRLALRVPLERLQQEVETFSHRAISDTLQTVLKMEQKRTDYRAALLWMRDISENLDPDTYKQLDKFRKVQAQVRSTKSKFDKIKLDSMQKVDLLAASRCNMFSNILGLYQSTLLQFWEKTCRTMVTVADSFQGYQYYEFSMLKHLTDESLKLAQNTDDKNESNEDDLFEGNDDKDKSTNDDKLTSNGDLLKNSKESCKQQKNHRTSQNRLNAKEDSDTDLLLLDDFKSTKPNKNFEDLNERLDDIFSSDYKDDPGNDIKNAMENNKVSASKKEELLGLGICDTEDRDNDKAFFEDLMISEDNSNSSIFNDFISHPPEKKSSNNQDWGFLFNSTVIDTNTPMSTMPSTNSQLLAGLMPSDLFETRSTFPSANSNASLFGSSTTDKKSVPDFFNSKVDNKDDNSAWLSMFADLDPLANPDSIGKKEGQITDT